MSGLYWGVGFERVQSMFVRMHVFFATSFSRVMQLCSEFSAFFFSLIIHATPLHAIYIRQAARLHLIMAKGCLLRRSCPLLHVAGVHCEFFAGVQNLPFS
eukprot:RCo029787